MASEGPQGKRSGPADPEWRRGAFAWGFNGISTAALISLALLLARSGATPDDPPGPLAIATSSVASEVSLSVSAVEASAPLIPAPAGRRPGQDFLRFSLEQSGARQHVTRDGVRLTVERGRRGEDGFATRLRIDAPGVKPHWLEGEVEGPSAVREIAVFKLTHSARLPAVMLKSHTGGLYCCTRSQIAVPAGRSYRNLDHEDGGWQPVDNYPTDISGDGIPDFISALQMFDYAFTVARRFLSASGRHQYCRNA